MGIDGFNPFVRDTIGEVSRQGTVSEFVGKRIAIDGHNWMFKQIYGAQKRSLATTDIAMFGVDRSEVLGNWLEMITDFLINIIEIGSTPVVIFDGEHPPEKKKTKDKRRKKQRETVDRITELEKEISKYDREITYTCLSDILDKLKISFKTFVDLCIMGGTDFNDNIPNYALKKSYNLLIKHGSIENLPPNLNTEILNYKRSREIFKVIP